MSLSVAFGGASGTTDRFSWNMLAYGDYVAVTDLKSPRNLRVYKYNGSSWDEQSVISMTSIGTGQIYDLQFSMSGDWIAVGSYTSSTKELRMYTKSVSNGTESWAYHSDIVDVSVPTGESSDNVARSHVHLSNGYLATNGTDRLNDIFIYRVNSSNNWEYLTKISNPIVNGSRVYSTFFKDFTLYVDPLTSIYRLVIIQEENNNDYYEANIYVKSSQNDTTWTNTYSITHPDGASNGDRFGIYYSSYKVRTVRMSGNKLAVLSHLTGVAPRTNTIMIFNYNESTDAWDHEKTVSHTGHDQWGHPFDFNEDYLVVTDQTYPDGDRKGRIILYDGSNDWSETSLAYSNSVNNDYVGRKVAITDDIVYTNSIHVDSFRGEVYYYSLSSSSSSGSGSGSSICYLGDTMVHTDQGLVKAEDLFRTFKKQQYTISQRPVRRVTRTRNEDTEMVLIQKNCFTEGIPNEDTFLTKQHKIMVPTTQKMEKCKNVARNSKYKKASIIDRKRRDIVYNIVLDTHSTVRVNNMVSETLHPANAFLKKFPEV